MLEHACHILYAHIFLKLIKLCKEKSIHKQRTSSKPWRMQAGEKVQTIKQTDRNENHCGK